MRGSGDVWPGARVRRRAGIRRRVVVRRRAGSGAGLTGGMGQRDSANTARGMEAGRSRGPALAFAWAAVAAAAADRAATNRRRTPRAGGLPGARGRRGAAAEVQAAVGLGAAATLCRELASFY